ncbi:MAG: phosphatase [Gemmiger sp.]|nr:phosphatase [Gemmiger sp.]
MMKKSTFGAALAFLAAATGALTAAALYLHHREKELDEYEKLLFNEDYEDMDAEEDAEAMGEDEFIIPEAAAAGVTPAEAAGTDAQG